MARKEEKTAAQQRDDALFEALAKNLPHKACFLGGMVLL